MNPYRSLIEGKYYDFVEIRKGFSLNVVETVFLRWGSHQTSEWSKNTTQGITLSTAGLFKLADREMNSNNIHLDVLSFILNRIEIRYTKSQYSNRYIFGGSEFESISLMLHY